MIKIPTIKEISTRIIEDYRGKSGEGFTGPVVKAMAWAYAGCCRLLYQAVLSAHKDIFPATARDEVLITLGRQLGLTPVPPTATEAEGEIDAAPGTLIPVGTMFKSPTGCLFITQEECSVSTNKGLLKIKALTPGTEGLLRKGDKLTITTPVATAGNSCIITNITVLADNGEEMEAFRARLIERMKLRPQGGSPIDYIVWGKTVPNVTHIFPFRADAPGAPAKVYFLVDESTGSRIPTLTDIENLKAKYSEADKMPICSVVDVLAPSEIPVDITITGFTGELSYREFIEKDILRLLNTKHPYIRGVDKNNIPEHLTKGELLPIITRYGNLTDLNITVKGAGTVDYTLLQNEVLTAGTILWN